MLAISTRTSRFLLLLMAQTTLNSTVMSDSSSQLWSSNGTLFSVVSAIVSYSARSKLDCAKECRQSTSCHSFAWESQIKICYLTPKIETASGTSNDLRLYVDGMDPCDPNPCLNNSVCNSVNGSCDCTGTGFMGATCSMDDPCDPNPCLNNGVCNSVNGSCDCTGTGFMGTTCSMHNPCDPQPCINNGTCRTANGSCDCTDTGYKGFHCEVQICPKTLGAHVRNVSWGGRDAHSLQGQILSCDDDYMTSNDVATVSCVDDVWSGATCNQRIFRNAAQEMTHNAPRPLGVGWKGCMRGVLINTTADPTVNKATIFLMETPDNQYFFGDFRSRLYTAYNETVFSTKLASGYVGTIITSSIKPFPFVVGVNFTIVFEFLSKTLLQMTVDGAAHTVWNYTYQSDLTRITGVWLGPGWTPPISAFHYVDLWCQ